MKKAFLLLALVGFLLYLPSLFGPFLWDDEDFVYANKYVANFQIDKFFSESQTAGRGKLSNYYRPVPQIVYATTHAVFGFNPFWFHLVNVLAHVGAAWTIFYFFKVFLEKNFGRAGILSLLIALVFLIHPVQTEAVSYISGLSDPLFVLFGFLALIYFPQKKSWLFFTLSLLSKETGVVFLGLMFLLNYKKIIPYCLIALVYLWYHLTFINSLDMAALWGNSIYGQSLAVRLLTFIQNLPTYIGLLIFPKDLFMERDYSIQIQTQILNPYLIMFIIFITVIIFIIRKGRILVFSFLAFFISFLPYSGIVLVNGIFYEHFLYLPLVFFFGFWIILTGSLFKRRVIIFITLIIFITFIIRNVARQLDWIDPVRFYSQTLAHAPASIRIKNGLAMAYADAGRNKEAIEQYNQAIAINPNVPNLYHNLANTYLAIGDINLAEENYQKAIEVDPNFIFSWQSLASLYQQTGQKEKLQELTDAWSRQWESNPRSSHYQ